MVRIVAGSEGRNFASYKNDHEVFPLPGDQGGVRDRAVRHRAVAAVLAGAGGAAWPPRPRRPRPHGAGRQRQLLQGQHTPCWHPYHFAG